MAVTATQLPSDVASRAVAMFPQLRRPADPVPWRGPIMRTSEIDAWQQLSREGYELRVPAESPEGLVGPFFGEGGCLDPVMPEGRIMRWFDPSVPADDGDFVLVRLSDATLEGVLERARALPPWQREAWFARYGEQPCNLATKWLRHGNRERILCWNTGGMPLGDNQILGVCRYVLLDGEPAFGSGPDTAGWSDVATAMQTVEINALETTNAPAASGADVSAPKVGVRKNRDGLSTTEAFSGFVHGFDSSGNPADTDAQFEVDGQLVSLPRSQFTSGATVKTGDNGDTWSGLILWESDNSDPFTVQGESVSVASGKFLGDNGWLYSSGVNGFNGDAAAFTATDNTLIVGTIRTSNSAGGITHASLFSSPLVAQGEELDALIDLINSPAEDAADVTGSNTADDVAPETGTASGTLSGFSGTDPALDWAYSRSGGAVVLRADNSAGGTSDQSGMSFFTLPSALRPSVEQLVPFYSVTTSAGSLLGLATVRTDGEIEFQYFEDTGSGVVTQTIPDSGTKGILEGATLTYRL